MNKWQHPLPENTITARFGATKNRKSPHRGTDYASSNKNALLSAVSAGVIAKIEYSACLGWYVVLKTDEDDVYFGYSHLYCNKHKTSECDGKDHTNDTCMKNLKVGQKVKAGQAVGRQGNSGTCSRGHHLHLTAHKTPDPRYAKVFDAEKFLNQKISAWQKQEAKKKATKPKTKPIESPVTAKQDKPDVIVPEKDSKPSASIWELLGGILAKKPAGGVCKCCGQAIK